MIKALIKGNDDERPLLVFGLSRMNIERLLAGKPMHFAVDELGIAGDILILYGQTEQTMLAELQPFMGPNTVVNNELTPPCESKHTELD